MTREQQKAIKELKKIVPAELRQQRKEFAFQYAHDTLYRFEGDFLYSALVLPGENSRFEAGIGLSYSFAVKPWILNDLYWKIQQMDMAEMRSQPKTFHFMGIFTINDIFRDTCSFELSKNNAGQVVHNVLVQLNDQIESCKKRLVSIESVAHDIDGYSISNLTKAMSMMYRHEYKTALDTLLLEDPTTEIVHADSKHKTAKDYAIEYCREKLDMK